MSKADPCIALGDILVNPYSGVFFEVTLRELKTRAVGHQAPFGTTGAAVAHLEVPSPGEFYPEEIRSPLGRQLQRWDGKPTPTGVSLTSHGRQIVRDHFARQKSILTRLDHE